LPLFKLLGFCTEWKRWIGCLILTGHIPQKYPISRDSFAERCLIFIARLLYRVSKMNRMPFLYYLISVLPLPKLPLSIFLGFFSWLTKSPLSTTISRPSRSTLSNSKCLSELLRSWAICPASLVGSLNHHYLQRLVGPLDRHSLTPNASLNCLEAEQFALLLQLAH